MKYDPHAIEAKWQAYWAQNGTFDAPTDRSKPKYYALIEFPYPSGDGLHVGHPRPYTAMDIVARKRRMEGYNVLFPFGWDAFGLPTENYAIKHKMHPAAVMRKNVARFKEQTQALGYSIDWAREINTTDPSYYRWTQWIFIRLFERGLAYKKQMSVNWCTSCQCVLANEEVVGGVCERCGAGVERRQKEQWMLRITEYAQRLLDDIDTVDYIPRVRAGQTNWIGRSTGANVQFAAGADEQTPETTITVFTTRPDTLFGATYMVMSPEHALLDEWAPLIKNIGDLRAYQAAAALKSDFERTELAKEKTGVRLEGVRAVNPVNGQDIPIYISDYVLASYGTGVIMAVPGHDQRDWDFAKAMGLPIVEVVAGGDISQAAYEDCDSGVMINSGFLDGLTVEKAKDAIIKYLAEQNIGQPTVNFKLRDWLFARQRYWGEPVPLVYCEQCGWVAIPDSELPLRLPEVDSYETTNTGDSPLAVLSDWVNTVCPACGGAARRETDTMPQWAGSSWYYLRYCDPHCDTSPASPQSLDYWMPVDWYNGGMEHVTLHLLYSRFWHKFLYDIGAVNTSEPYKKRTAHGMILAEDGEKMSKSRGNVINPDDIIKEFGADTLRLYVMFIGDFEKTAIWQSKAVKGCFRFIERVVALADRLAAGDAYSPANEIMLHRTIQKVTADIEAMKFNTAIAQMMTLVNQFYENGVNRAEYNTLLRLLCPFAPHVCEELYQHTGGRGDLAFARWPEFDAAKTVDSSLQIAVQINGKLKTTITLPTDCDDVLAREAALADEKVAAAVDGMNIVKVIVVKNKIVNIVVK